MSDRSCNFELLTTELRSRADQSPAPAAVNLRSIQDVFDAIAAGDLASVVARADEHVTLEISCPPEFPFIRHASGADAFREAVEKVLFGRETGTIRATGVDYDMEFVERFTFRDDRLIAVHIVAAHRSRAGE